MAHRRDDQRERHLEHLLERDMANDALVEQERTDGDQRQDDQHAAGKDDLALEHSDVLAARLLMWFGAEGAGGSVRWARSDSLRGG